MVKAIAAQVRRGHFQIPAAPLSGSVALAIPGFFESQFPPGVAGAELELAALVAGMTNRDVAQTGFRRQPGTGHAGAVPSPLGE